MNNEIKKIINECVKLFYLERENEFTKQRLRLLIEIKKESSMRRRRMQLQLVQYLLHCYSEIGLIPRNRIWRKIRSTSWWDDIVLRHFEDVDWIRNFRVDKSTFLEICDLVRDGLSPNPAYVGTRQPISVEKQVGISLYKLASCCELRVIANNMGVSKTKYFINIIHIYYFFIMFLM